MADTKDTELTKDEIDEITSVLSGENADNLEKGMKKTMKDEESDDEKEKDNESESESEEEIETPEEEDEEIHVRKAMKCLKKAKYNNDTDEDDMFDHLKENGYNHKISKKAIESYKQNLIKKGLKDNIADDTDDDDEQFDATEIVLEMATQINDLQKSLKDVVELLNVVIADNDKIKKGLLLDIRLNEENQKLVKSISETPIKKGLTQNPNPITKNFTQGETGNNSNNNDVKQVATYDDVKKGLETLKLSTPDNFLKYTNVLAKIEAQNSLNFKEFNDVKAELEKSIGKTIVL